MMWYPNWVFTGPEISPNFKAKAALADLEERRKSLLEEDRFARVVFGKAFARAYYSVTGGRVESDKG